AQQQPGQALAVYRRMAELFPKEPQPPFLIGRVLMSQRQLTEARKEFEKSLEISPSNLATTEALTDLDIAERQYAPALDRVQKLIDKDQKQPQALAIRGKIFLAQNDFAHAESDFRK